MCSKAIVSVSDAENEYITIDNVKYALDIANSFSGADKDKNMSEIDLLIEQKGKALPIKMKSSKNYKRHSVLNKLINIKSYNIDEA